MSMSAGGPSRVNGRARLCHIVLLHKICMGRTCLSELDMRRLVLVTSVYQDLIDDLEILVVL